MTRRGLRRRAGMQPTEEWVVVAAVKVARCDAGCRWDHTTWAIPCGFFRLIACRSFCVGGGDAPCLSQIARLCALGGCSAQTAVDLYVDASATQLR